MYCPKLAWNRSPAKERNRNRSCLGRWLIPFLVFLIPLRDRGLQSKAQDCGGPGTCTQGQQEPQVRAERVGKNSSRELKRAVCACLSKHDSLSCFCYSETKHIWLMCQAAKAANNPRSPPPLMPGEGDQNACDLGKSRLGSELHTSFMHHYYTWWAIWTVNV